MFNKPSPTTKKFIQVFLIFIILGGGGGALWLLTNLNHNPIPASIRNTVSFPLYYPTALPKGYSLNPSSIRSSKGTIFYDLSGASPRHTISISQQPTPKGFDPKALFAHNPLPTTISPIGTVYDLSAKDQGRFMVTAPDTLIFISSASKISNSDLQHIVNGLKLSK